MVTNEVSTHYQEIRRATDVTSDYAKGGSDAESQIELVDILKADRSTRAPVKSYVRRVD
jgi:hypothetical protein